MAETGTAGLGSERLAGLVVSVVVATVLLWFMSGADFLTRTTSALLGAASGLFFGWLVLRWQQGR